VKLRPGHALAGPPSPRSRPTFALPPLGRMQRGARRYLENVTSSPPVLQPHRFRISAEAKSSSAQRVLLDLVLCKRGRASWRSSVGPGSCAQRTISRSPGAHDEVVDAATAIVANHSSEALAGRDCFCAKAPSTRICSTRRWSKRPDLAVCALPPLLVGKPDRPRRCRLAWRSNRLRTRHPSAAGCRPTGQRWVKLHAFR
jgi:hypothetical protein